MQVKRLAAAQGRVPAGRSVLSLRSMSRILVVEDDRDIAELIRHYLERAGHGVELLASGSEAVLRAREQAPDVLILDLMLPGMSGLEVCRALRADPRPRGCRSSW